MTESNRDIVIIIGKLVLISVVASALLAITYVPTSEQLKKNYAEARTATLAELMPQAAEFEAVYGDEIINDEGDREILYYRAKDSSGNLIGYAFFRQHPGAQGLLEVAGGVDVSFNEVTGMSVMSHTETPGLGSKITEPAFRDQFKNVKVADLSLSKSGGAIDSITGATISSQAVIDALNAQVEVIQVAEG
ncbi:electron transport complex protein RnfG [Methanococcoides vulcani]|uniref:Ion-translocating oxidoreductase complex subunit G n=1 Tax=Methanococcoides vulcani TaxID=1353158 RepID=A0A1H9Y5M6_9EURY|nr:Rnf electron transport complex subunit RnfG [Methanococcoides vulcani]SES64082.1 electron transport complex protein RnfG [Methanococcoides vulcani]